MALPPLTFNVDADLTRFNAKMGAAAATVKTSAATMGRSFKSLSDKVGGLATKVGLIGGVLGGAAVKSAASFEKSMSLAFTQTEMTTDQFEDLTKEIRAAAVEFGSTDLSAVGGAVYDAFSTGARDAVEALDIVSVAMEAAAGSTVGLDTAVSFVTQQWKTFQPEARDARAELDRLAATVKVGSGTAEEFASAFTNVSAQASAFGLTQAELSGLMADLSTAMGGATKAATSVQQILTALETPTTRQTEVIDLLNRSIIENAGVNEASIAMYGGVEEAVRASGAMLLDFSKAGVEAAGGIVPFTQNLTSIINTAQESGENIRGMIRSVEGFNGLMTLAADGAQGFAEKVESIGNASGGTAENFATAAETFDQKFAEMIATGKEFGLTLIEDTGFIDDLGEMLTAGVEKLKGWTTELKNTIDTNPELIAQWKENIVTGAALLGKVFLITQAVSALSGVVSILADTWGLLKRPMTWVFATGIPGLIRAFVALGAGIKALLISTGPIGWLILAIGAIGTAIYLLVDDWDAAWESIRNAAITSALWIIEQWEFLVDGITGLGGAIYDALSKPFSDFFGWVTKKWENLWNWFSSFEFSDILPDFLQFGQGGPVPAVPGFANGGEVQEFHAGGSVRGPAGLDVIPARLTEGEFVINAKASDMIGKPLLEALNRIGQGGTSSAPLIGELSIGDQGYGGIDETTIREQFLPELERLIENRLSPRGRSIR